MTLTPFCSRKFIISSSIVLNFNIILRLQNSKISIKNKIKVSCLLQYTVQIIISHPFLLHQTQPITEWVFFCKMDFLFDPQTMPNQKFINKRKKEEFFFFQTCNVSSSSSPFPPIFFFTSQ